MSNAAPLFQPFSLKLFAIGSVLVFLPQILILFFFILVLEDSGYLPRAAFLLDNLMGRVGLSGRAFIPLLSSFACAIPGIMATRSIANPRDRLVTILIAPLMTCSARLPVYALLIGAFIPQRELWGGIELQGLVLFVLARVSKLSIERTTMAILPWLAKLGQPCMWLWAKIRTPCRLPLHGPCLCTLASGVCVLKSHCLTT